MIHQDKFTLEEQSILLQLQEQYHLRDYLLDYLIAYIGFESGFDSNHEFKFFWHKPVTGYYYLMPRVAKAYGIKSNTLSKWTGAKQLLFLHKYLKPFEFKLKKPENIVGCMIDPLYIGANAETNVFNSKLQYQYLDTKGVLPLKKILDKVEGIYLNG